MLRKLPGDSLHFEAQDRGRDKEKMLTQCIAPTKLEIKINAQVMLLRNQNGGSGGLVNGSIGTVIGFTDQQAENVRTGPSDESLPSLNAPGELLPKVRFMTEWGGTREVVVGREEWTLEMPDGEFLAGRVQIPLCLAWALSIHKSQGQTLPKVRVDLGKVFERGKDDEQVVRPLRMVLAVLTVLIFLCPTRPGQAYVALSRATTLEGLQVLNFDPQKVMVHPKVDEFYSSMSGMRHGDASIA